MEKETDILLSAARHVYDTFYMHPYPKPPKNAKSGFYMDWGPVHGVQRPNHALGNAVRKAVLVESVVDTYKIRASHLGLSLASEDFNFMPEHMKAMQLAMLFESTGRKSEIGFFEDGEEYLSYKHAGLDNFRNYAKKIGISDNVINVC